MLGLMPNIANSTATAEGLKLEASYSTSGARRMMT